MRLGLAILMLMGLAACSQGTHTPPPPAEEMLAEITQRLREFVDRHRTSGKVAEARQELEVQMESVSAQAEQFGGKLKELQTATQKLLEHLQSQPTAQALQQHLNEFITELDRLHPAS